MARHAALLGAVQCLKVLLGMTSTLLLAKLLVPADFGLMAVVSPALALVGMTQDLGLSQVVVQQRDLGQGQASSMYWVTFALGCAGGLTLVAVSPALSWFFGQPGVAALMLGVACVPPVQAAYAMHASLLARHMRFAVMARADLAATVTSTLVGLAAAWWLRSAWALVLATVVGASLQLVLYRAACDWFPGRPRFYGLDGAHRFGASLSGANLFNFVHRNADNVIVFKAFGPTPMGLYDRAFKLLVYPMQQVHAPAARIMVPLLSSLAGRPAEYRQAFLDCSTLLMAAVQPFMLYAAIRSATLVDATLGPAWVASAAVFSCFAAVGMQQVYTSTIGWLLVTQGRGREVLGLAAFGAASSVSSYLLGLHWGLSGVAASYAFTDTFVRVPVLFRVVGRSGPVGVKDLCMCAAPHAVAAMIAAVVLLACPVPASPLKAVVAGLGLSFATYHAVLACFSTKRHAMSVAFVQVLGMASGIPARVLRFTAAPFRPWRTTDKAVAG